MVFHGYRTQGSKGSDTRQAIYITDNGIMNQNYTHGTLKEISEGAMWEVTQRAYHNGHTPPQHLT
jgi:hypothetical protein